MTVNPFAFRLRFRLSVGSYIDIDEKALTLLDSEGELVTLHAIGSDTIRGCRNLVVKGRPYPDEKEADRHGKAWRHAMVLALTSIRVGADFGERGSLGWVNTQLISERTGQRILQDRLGVSVYQEKPTPRFMGVGTASLSVGKNRDTFNSAVSRSWSLGATLQEPALIAYYLFSSSASQDEIESRFILLMMALETLIDQRIRSEAVAAHVDSLLEHTEQNPSLSKDEKKSLCSALNGLKQESVGESGRRVVGTLGSETYGGKKPKQFFSKCYGLRSKLVHGAVPRPGRDELNGVITELERLVAELITALSTEDVV